MGQTDWNSEFVAVDWGNSNRRAYRVGADGNTIDSFMDARGVLTLSADCMENAVSEIRARLGDLPMLLGGAIGSDRGWHNAPYVECPADADEIAARLYWVDERTGIVPGVSQIDPDDVMRGEEIQALGALRLGLTSPDSLLCSPGTHSKWLRLKGGRIASFTSAMTGEIFSLLRQHSILSDVLNSQVTGGAGFDKGVEVSLDGKPLSQALFGIRASHLLGRGRGDEASYASGLLIGADWRDNVTGSNGDDVIGIVGTPDLCSLYARAGSLAGYRTREIDGAAAFIAGMIAIKERLP